MIGFLRIVDSVWILVWPLLLVLQIPLSVMFLPLAWSSSGKQRLGWVRGQIQDAQADVWVHGSSIGEWNALKPLCKRLDASLHCTCSSRNAYELQPVHNLHFAPFDSWIFALVRVFLVRPKVFVVAEVDLWPSTLFVLRILGVKIVWINARADRSMGQVIPAMKNFFSMLMPSKRLQMHTVDSEAAARFSFLRPSFSWTDYNLKWARERMERTTEPSDRQIVLLASLHGDEIEVLDSMADWLLESPETRAVWIAPRYLEELPVLQSKVRALQNRFAKLNSNGCWFFEEQFGGMDRLYQQAWAVVVGGSFDGVGGHNPVECAQYGSHIVCGPSMHSQKVGVSLLQRVQNFHQVETANKLSAVLNQLPKDLCDTAELIAQQAFAVKQVEEIAARIGRAATI